MGERGQGIPGRLGVVAELASGRARCEVVGALVGAGCAALAWGVSEHIGQLLNVATITCPAHVHQLTYQQLNSAVLRDQPIDWLPDVATTPHDI